MGTKLLRLQLHEAEAFKAILYRNYRQNVLSSSEVTTPHINETKTLLKLK